MSGLLPDLGDGFGAISVQTPGLQNGSPDGVALVDSSGSVVQFLSYEGFFTATEGPLAGVTSEDIGVIEPSDAVPGESIQLTDTGWVTGLSETFGQRNIDQSLSFSGASCLLYTSPSPRDGLLSRMPSSA